MKMGSLALATHYQMIEKMMINHDKSVKPLRLLRVSHRFQTGPGPGTDLQNPEAGRPASKRQFDATDVAI